MRKTLTLSALITVLGLAGCNGDGEPRDGDPTEADAGATTSPDASATPTPDATTALPDASTATFLAASIEATMSLTMRTPWLLARLS